MSNQLHRPNTQRPTVATRTHLQMIVMAFAIFYWLSPVDAMPFFPFDDIAVMVAGYLYYTKHDAGVIEEGAE